MVKALLALLIYLPMSGLAQLQVSDTARWQLISSLTGRINTGNVERSFVTPEINITHINANEKLGFASSNRYTYGSFGKNVTENDLLSRNFLYLQPQARVYPYLMYWMQTHQRQLLAFRYQAGLGLTWAAVKNQSHLLKISMTGSYEQAWYKQTGLSGLEDPATDRYKVIRSTLRVNGNHFFLNGIFNLFYEGYFQRALDDSKNWRVYAEGGLNMRVIQGFGARVFASYEYQEVHVVTVKPNDLIISFGINYKWLKN